MGNLSGFDASQVEPNAGFEPIPAGEYNACIVNSEMKMTKNGNGQYLNLELSILDGPYQNRRLFDKLNLQNPNAEAVTIAKGTLSAICRAVNVLAPDDSAQLHMKPLRINVGVRKREDTGEMQNTIKSYKPRNASAPAPMLATAGGVSAQKAPWAQG